MIRRATFGDVGAIVTVLRDAYDRSIYAGRVDFDDVEANRILCQAIQRHGFKSAVGTWAQVAVVDDRIEGVVVGALFPVYLIGKQLMATDLFWTCTAACPARQSIALIMSFVDWAKAHPKVVEIQCGATALTGSADLASKILGRLGMEPFGSIHRMEVAR